jgi:5-hydroxyisourate hydrolase
MKKLSTHVLDLTAGRPGANMHIELWRITDDRRERLKSVRTNGDGRVSEPLLQGEVLEIGTYELTFHVGEFFSDRGILSPFLTVVPIRFSISDPEASYHVPLLVTPWAYQTYRGS